MGPIDPLLPGAPTGLFVGLCTLDVIYRVPRLPAPDEKIAPLDQLVVAGGPATNAAVAFRHLGGRARLVVALGEHPLSTLAREEIESWGVEVEPVEPSLSYHPPLVTVLVQERGGERAVVSAGARGLRVAEEVFDPRWLEGVSVVLVDGHLVALSIRVARAARAAGIPVVLDAGSWKDGMDELLLAVDHVVCAERFRPPGCETEADVFARLDAAGVAEQSITRGARPILHRRRGGEVEEQPVASIEAVDTLAAGDIFHGAYAYHLLDPARPIHKVLEASADVASRACEAFGPRAWMARPRKVYATPE